MDAPFGVFWLNCIGFLGFGFSNLAQIYVDPMVLSKSGKSLSIRCDMGFSYFLAYNYQSHWTTIGLQPTQVQARKSTSDLKEEISILYTNCVILQKFNSFKSGDFEASGSLPAFLSYL